MAYAEVQAKTLQYGAQTFFEVIDQRLCGGNVKDEDTDDNFTYSLNDDRFEIVEGVLKLKEGQSIDGSNEPTVAIEITVTDSQGAQYTETLNLRVGMIQLDNYNFDENASGVSVGDITVTGLDGSELIYSLSGEDARYFEITDQGVVKLKDGYGANYEGDDGYTLIIKAENNVGESISSGSDEGSTKAPEKDDD